MIAYPKWLIASIESINNSGCQQIDLALEGNIFQRVGAATETI